MLDMATNLDSGLKTTDTQSGFRAFAASTIPSFRFKQRGLAIESEMLADAARAGLRIAEVEIGVRYDVDGSSEHPVSHGLRVFFKIIHDIELNHPLYYFLIPGLFLIIFGVGMGLIYLRNYLNGSGLNFGPTLLMILSTLVGSSMVFTGLILHSLSNMLCETRK